MAMGTQIPYFAGEKIDEWILKIEERLEFYNFPTEGAKVLYASFFLVDSAQQWWCDWRIKKRENYTLEEFFEAIYQRFGTNLESPLEVAAPSEEEILKEKEEKIINREAKEEEDGEEDDIRVHEYKEDSYQESFSPGLINPEIKENREEHGEVPPTEKESIVAEEIIIEGGITIETSESFPYRWAIKSGIDNQSNNLGDFGERIVHIDEHEPHCFVVISMIEKEKITRSMNKHPGLKEEDEIQRFSLAKITMVSMKNSGYFDLSHFDMLPCSWENLSIDRLFGDMKIFIWDPGGSGGRGGGSNGGCCDTSLKSSWRCSLPVLRDKE